MRVKVHTQTAPACKISGLNDARTHLQTVLINGPVTSIFHAIGFDEILSHASAKKEKKLRVSNFALLWIVFK